jgi:hypothetical protein
MSLVSKSAAARRKFAKPQAKSSRQKTAQRRENFRAEIDGVTGEFGFIQFIAPIRCPAQIG